MTKQTINVGTAVNTRNGDTLRVAFTKANDNFTELYSLVTADVQIPSQTGNAGKFLKTSGSSLSFQNISYNELINAPVIPSAQIQSDWAQSNTAALDFIKNKPTLFSGSYTDLTNKPTIFSGSYTDLTNKPVIPSAQIQSDWSQSDISSLDFIKNKPTLFSGSYNDLTNKPTIFSGSYTDLTNKPTLFSGSYTDLTNKPTLFSGSYTDLTNKPSIPTSINDLSDVNISSVSNGQILKYNATMGYWEPGADLTGAGGSGISLTDLSASINGTASGSGSLSYNSSSGVFTYTPPVLFSGSYTDLTNKPTLFSGSYNDLTNKPTLFSGSYTDLTNKPSIPTVNDSTITITAGTGLSGGGSFTLNESSAVNITLNSTITQYTLPTASNSTLGGIKIGTGLSIDGSGVVSTSYSLNQNLSSTSNVTFNNVTTTGQIVEAFQTYSTSITSGSTVTLNCTNGNLWNITSSIAGNWTAAATNLAITTGQATSITLIINQGSTAYIPNALTVNATSVTINWQGGSAPTGSANKKDIISFSILETASNTYLVFGQLVTFG